MECTAIHTRVLRPPRDDLFSALKESLPPLREKDILVITSKVVSIHQGRSVAAKDVRTKDELIMREADAYIPRSESPGERVMLTLKDHTLIPSAGIDESNANGYFILWPRHASEFAKEVHAWIRATYHLKDCGVVITDSHCVPLRYGVVGVAIGWYGIEPLKSYIGSPDIFSRPLTMTQVNIIDALAASAVLSMGEGDEQTPCAIIRDVPMVRFVDHATDQAIAIPPEEDIYAPLLKPFRKHDA